VEETKDLAAWFRESFCGIHNPRELKRRVVGVSQYTPVTDQLILQPICSFVLPGVRSFLSAMTFVSVRGLFSFCAPQLYHHLTSK